jgi:hypothetical protein
LITPVLATNSTVIVTAGALTATYISNSGGYEIWKITSTITTHDSGQTTGIIEINSVDYNISIIGGGASGRAGGGGGGEINNQTGQTSSGDKIIKIGRGGSGVSWTEANEGGNSSFNYFIAIGGHKGGNPTGGLGGGTTGATGADYGSSSSGGSVKFTAIDGNQYAGAGGAGYTGTVGGSGGGGTGSSNIGAPNGIPGTENTGSAGGGAYGTGTDHGGDGANGLIIIKALPYPQLPIANFTVSSYQQHKDDLINMTDDSDCYQCLERIWNITREIPISPVYHTNISNLDISKHWPDWGIYNIIKQVRNSSGMNETSKKVTILNITPDSDFIGIPTSGTRPLSVSFTDLSTGNITGWLWTFYDGNTSTAQNPSNLFSLAGVYDIKLITSNPDESNENHQVGYITITEPTPTPTPIPPAPSQTQRVRFINIQNPEKEPTIEEILGSIWTFITGEMDLSGPQGTQGAQGIPGIECVNCSGSVLAYDLENISHPLGSVPRVVLITGSNSSQIISVVNRTNQTFQVSIRDFNDTPGANETIDWMVKL